MESAGIHRNREGPFETVAAGTNHKDIPDRVIRVELITRGCASRFLHPDKASLLLVECPDERSGSFWTALVGSSFLNRISNLSSIKIVRKPSVVGGRNPQPHTLEARFGQVNDLPVNQSGTGAGRVYAEEPWVLGLPLRPQREYRPRCNRVISGDEVPRSLWPRPRSTGRSSRERVVPLSDPSPRQPRMPSDPHGICKIICKPVLCVKRKH